MNDFLFDVTMSRKAVQSRNKVYEKETRKNTEESKESEHGPKEIMQA